MEDSKRIAYFDLLRIVAGVLIVMVHVSAQGMETLSLYSMEYFWANFWNGAAFIGVAVFVMLSGALELDPAHPSDLRRILLHKAARLFLIYYFWKAVFQCVIMVEQGISFTPGNIKDHLLLALIQERGYYHLWFFLMLAVLFLFVPMIKPAAIDLKVCRYYLAGFFLIAVCYPVMMHYDFKFKYLLADFMERADFYLFTGYLGYFILGHFLHQSKSRKEGQAYVRWVLCILAVVCMLLSGYLGVLASRKSGVMENFLNTPFTPMIFLASIFVFLAGKGMESRLKGHPKLCKCFRLGADLTLGICLLHPLFLNWMNHINLTPDIMPRVISIPLLTIVTVIPSGLAAWICKKIPLLKKLM